MAKSDKKPAQWVVSYKLRGHEPITLAPVETRRAADELEDALRQTFGRLLEWAHVEEEE